MNLDRVFTGEFDGKTIKDRFAVAHIKNVLRLVRGDVFAGYDGERRWVLKITGAGRDTIEVEVDGVYEIPTRSLRRITLAAALIKAKPWELLIEKATEIGVAAIQPVICERTVVKVKSATCAGKMERWRRVAASAAAQSAGRVPVIMRPVGFDVYIEKVSECGNKYIMSGGGASRSLSELMLHVGRDDVVLLVGPEGDWTERELTAASDAGFVKAHLGPGILRAETAALAAAAIAALVG